MWLSSAIIIRNVSIFYIENSTLFLYLFLKPKSSLKIQHDYNNGVSFLWDIAISTSKSHGKLFRVSAFSSLKIEKGRPGSNGKI